MPLFTKTEDELKTHQDKWLYFLKNLPDLEHIPAILKEYVFERAFHTAEIAAMPEEEREFYQRNLDDYRTYMATIETAENRGFAEGELKKSQDIARKMKQRGDTTETIAELTGLSVETLKQLN